MNFIKSYVIKPTESVEINFTAPILRFGYLQTSSNNLQISKVNDENTLFYLPNSRSYFSHFNFTTGVNKITIFNSGDGNAICSILVEEWGN